MVRNALILTLMIDVVAKLVTGRLSFRTYGGYRGAIVVFFQTRESHLPSALSHLGLLGPRGWRRWLTDQYLRAWLDKRNYYRIRSAMVGQPRSAHRGGLSALRTTAPNPDARDFSGFFDRKWNGIAIS
jgi:hypothetical protein